MWKELEVVGYRANRMQCNHVHGGVPSRLWHPPGLLSLGGLGLRRWDFSGFKHCNAS